MNYENVIGGNAKKFVNEYRPNLKGVKRLELEQMLREFAIEQVKLLATPAVVKSVCPNCGELVKPVMLGCMCPSCACDM